MSSALDDGLELHMARRMAKAFLDAF